MTTATEPVEARRYVPYVSFATLQNLLIRMANEGAPPDRIDRSYLSGMSGGYQAQLLGAMRALGLIDLEGAPTAELHTLTTVLDREFPGFMQRQISQLYPEANALTRGTALQLNDVFKEQYGISGSTIQGAIRFYLDACKFAGVEVSPHFKAPTRARSTSALRRPQPMTSGKRPSGGRKPGTATTVAFSNTSASNTERVELNSGGSLTLTMTLDLFALSQEDRAFVFDLIDRVQGYKALIQISADDGPSSQEDDTD